MTFDELQSFLEVARHGSVFAAAEALRTSRTTLRRQLDALEARAGVPLLIRSRNGVVPTEAGRRLLESGTRLTQEFSATLAAVREAGVVPSGELRVAIPVGTHPLAVGVLAAMMADRWPQMRFHLRVYESPADAERMGIEALISLGGPRLDESWTTRVAGLVPRYLLASPDYLANRGTPKRLQDLAKHDLLGWLAPGETGTEWPTTRGPFLVQPRMVTSDVHLLHVLAHEGRGIAFVPDGGFPPMAGYEPLVRVLPDLVSDWIELRVAARAATANLPRVRAVLDVAEQFASMVGASNIALPTEVTG